MNQTWTKVWQKNCQTFSQRSTYHNNPLFPFALNGTEYQSWRSEMWTVQRWGSCHAGSCRLVPDAVFLAHPSVSHSISLFLPFPTFPDNAHGDPPQHWWMQHSLGAAWTSQRTGYLHMQPKSNSLSALLLIPLFSSLFFGFFWGQAVEKKMPYTTAEAQFSTHGLSSNGPSVLALICSVCCLWWSLGQLWREIVLSLSPCLLLLVSPLLSGKWAGEDNLGGRCWCSSFCCPP